MLRTGNRSGVLAQAVYDDAASGRLSGIADRNGRQVIWYDYDAENRVIAVRDHENPDSSRTVRYHYDAQSRLSRVTDVSGHQTVYTYAAMDRTMSVQAEPDTYYRVFGYGPDRDSAAQDACGLPETMVTPQTRFTSVLALIEDPLGRITRMTHTESGEITAYENDAGVTRFALITIRAKKSTRLPLPILRASSRRSTTMKTARPAACWSTAPRSAALPRIIASSR